MCAIVDTNCLPEVFARVGRSRGGKLFYDWMTTGHGKLVVGGRCRHEIKKSEVVHKWMRQAKLNGRAIFVEDVHVNRKEQKIEAEGGIISDDPHIIALALISGARLLHSRDGALQKDFTRKEIVNNPRGKVFPTEASAKAQRTLLENKSLCRC